MSGYGEAGLAALAYVEAIRTGNTINAATVVNTSPPREVIKGLVSLTEALLMTCAASAGIPVDELVEALQGMFLLACDEVAS